MTATSARVRPAPGRADGSRSRLATAWASPLTTYYLLIGSTTLLLVLGLVMVLSSSSIDSLVHHHSPYAVFLDQAKYALIGLPVMWAATRLTGRWHRRLAWPALAAALALQAAVFIPGVGVRINGNLNWVNLRVFTAQPSEAIKLALAMWLGVVLARKAHLLRQLRHVLVPALLGVAASVALVLAGHDLGTTLVLVMLVAGALYVAGVPMWMFGLGSGLAAGGVLAFVFGQPDSNRSDRIHSWLAATCTDTLGSCMQTLHGTWALASGGVLGLGLGQSRQKWSYLPAAHNDFIFAVIGEELGLLGAIVVLLLFGVLAVAMTRLIRRHQDMFVRVATGAIGTWIVGQALINIAVVIGLLPVVGLPLPLVSAGGSALITTLLAIGVLVSFARSEPGAQEALTARAGAVRRSLAVLGRAGGTAGEDVGRRVRRTTRG